MRILNSIKKRLPKLNRKTYTSFTRKEKMWAFEIIIVFFVVVAAAAAAAAAVVAIVAHLDILKLGYY